MEDYLRPNWGAKKELETVFCSFKGKTLKKRT
jgi:hypothetical protein